MELRPKNQFDPFGLDVDAYDDGHDLNLDNIDFNDPAHFRELYGPNFPVPESSSPEDVRREAKERSRRIFASYDMLREILMRHEATIHRRLAKKTKQQRLKILLTAWPNISTVHRPDFMAFRKETTQERISGTRY